MTCPRCGYDHTRVSPTAWLWALKNAKERPTASHAGVLAMIAARVNAKTGCGRMSRDELIGDLAVVSKEAVTKATVWALDNGLLVLLQRGHRLGDGSTTKSLWALADPATASMAGSAAVDDESQRLDSPPLRADPGEPQELDRPISKAGYPASSNRPSVYRPSVKEPAPVGPASGASASKAGSAAVEALPMLLPDLPGAALEVTPTAVAAPADSAQTLVAEWLDHCPHRPPQRIIGQIARDLKGLLGEGIAYEHVRAGLAAWQRKGSTHPATLASFVHTAMNGHGGQQGRHEEQVLAGRELTEELKRRGM